MTREIIGRAGQEIGRLEVNKVKDKEQMGHLNLEMALMILISACGGCHFAWVKIHIANNIPRCLDSKSGQWEWSSLWITVHSTMISGMNKSASIDYRSWMKSLTGVTTFSYSCTISHPAYSFSYLSASLLSVWTISHWLWQTCLLTYLLYPIFYLPNTPQK